MPYPKDLIDVLRETARPVFLFGSTPPKDGTLEDKARETCKKFAERSSVLATDGFIVYDIQDEGARTTTERPFPFRKTMDPSLYASYFPQYSGKKCIVYKCVSEGSVEEFDDWLKHAHNQLGHNCFNLVGAASSKDAKGISLSVAGNRVQLHRDLSFGCVCIPERHTTKNNEDLNMVSKVKFGAEWFITQGIFDATPAIKLIKDYGDLCRKQGVTPKKMILTFAPCGRKKTMTFIRWLGMHVPDEVEQRIFAADDHVRESIIILNEILVRILDGTGGSGVPIGLNVESLSIFNEEINGAHTLFQSLQSTLLSSGGSPWTVRWLYVRGPHLAGSDSEGRLTPLGISRPNSPSASVAHAAASSVRAVTVIASASQSGQTTTNENVVSASAVQLKEVTIASDEDAPAETKINTTATHSSHPPQERQQQSTTLSIAATAFFSLVVGLGIGTRLRR